MNPNNKYISVLDLALDETTQIASIAKMINSYGFCTQDEFGGLVLVNSDTTDVGEIKLRRRLLDELVGGFKGGDYDRLYYRERETSHNIMQDCGWPYSSSSEFQSAVVNLEGNLPIEKGENKTPAPQSLFYTILIQTLLSQLQIPEEVLRKIAKHGEKSDQTFPVVEKLGLDKLAITPKIFQRHIRDALSHYDSQLPRQKKKYEQQQADESKG